LRSLAQREEQKALPLTTTEQKYLDRFRPQQWDGRIEQLSPDGLLRQWGCHIACTLHDSMAKPDDPQFTFYTVPTFKVRTRKRLQIIHGYFEGIEYRLALDRDALQVLQTVIATEPGARRLLSEVQWSLLPMFLLHFAWGLPRGKKHALIQKHLMVVVQCAVFVAEELVKKATSDQAFRSRLQPILVRAECPWAARKSLRILTLANRALRPALVRYHIKALVDRRDISDILDPATRTSFTEFFNSRPERLAWWFELLLGEEGQAARTLNLDK
ncbi:MAG: hypothetical protein NTX84_03300, partial [Nitrospirae bacterium]|nr:hypothetical protein [Nitrospirota bacterium]